MSQVISVKDLQDMLRSGRDVRSLPEDALLTPSARDFLRDLERNGGPATTGRAGDSAAIRAVTSKSSRGEIEAFFNSPATHDLKLQICDIGRRLWQRAYVDGN